MRLECFPIIGTLLEITYGNQFLILKFLNLKKVESSRQAPVVVNQEVALGRSVGECFPCRCPGNGAPSVLERRVNIRESLRVRLP